MPRPSDAQREAGNYAMDRLRLHGLPITIENRKGTIRRGADWSVVMPYDYGYIRRTLGADGDQVDCFIGPHRQSQFVVVVNNYAKQTGAFDEVKVGLGYHTLEQAKAAYRQGYRGGNVPRAEFTTTTVQRLKEWLKIKQTWAKFDLHARPERLTMLANPMKRVVQFRQPAPKEEKERPSLARKVAAGLGAAAVVGGFYKYASSRPDVKKHATRMKTHADNVAYAQGLKTQAPPSSTPSYEGGAGFTYGVKPSRAPLAPIAKPGEIISSYTAGRRKDAAIAARKTAEKAQAAAKPKAENRGKPLLKRKVLPPLTDEERRVAKLKPGSGWVQQPTSLRARALLTQFQDRNDDGTLGVSTSPLTAYRKASRVVPWVGRAGQAAGDLGDMATGKEVKDPFYKKTWFKRAATTAAIGIPLLAANLARSGERKQADGRRPSTGTDYGDKVDRLTHSAADGKRKLYNKLGLAAKLKPILLQAVVTHLKNFDARAEDKPRNRWVAPVAIGLTGVAAAGGIGAYRGVKKLRTSLQPAIDKFPGTLDAVRSAGENAARSVKGAAASVKSASDSFRGSVDKVGGLAGAVHESKGKTWLRRRLGFQTVSGRILYFDYTDRNNWDLRDARGKSARVFAPGSKPRDRREKNWNEKTENIRLVRNIAIAGTLAGAGAALHYRNKANNLTPKVPKATNVVSHDFRKPKQASAEIVTINFSKRKGSLDRLLDATSKNVSLPDRPDLPGEGAVKFVYGLPPKRRAGVLKVLGAGALAGGGVAAGVLTKRPKTGAALGGLGAGLLLG